MDDERKKASRAKSNANLRPRAINTRPDAHEIRRKGQAAQQEAYRRRKAIKEIAAEALSMVCPDSALPASDIVKAAKDAAKDAGQPLTTYQALYLAQLARAISAGDTAAAAFCRDSAGDKPTDKVSADVAQVTAGDLELLRKLDASGDLDALSGAQKG